jgi:hypothetical protein
MFGIKIYAPYAGILSWLYVKKPVLKQALYTISRDLVIAVY